jgi:Gpi18-like mannosyltransferase
VEQQKNEVLGTLLFCFVLTRLVLEAIGLLSQFYFPSARSIFPVADLLYHQQQPQALEQWARWDSEWYILVAEKGYNSYDAFKTFGHGKYLPQETAKFFPAYPAGINLLNRALHNSVLSGVILSNAASILFLYYLTLLAGKLFDQNAAFQAGLLYLLFPTSFFLNAVYSESLFLAAVAAAFYYIEEKKLLPAAVACALLVTARPQGMLAALPLLWLAGTTMTDNRKKAILCLAAAFAVPLLGYCFYIQQTFGSFRWITETSRYWRGEIRYPFYALARFFSNPVAIHGQHNSLIDFSFVLVNLLALIFSVRKLKAPYFFYSLIMIVFPLCSSLFSFSRLCLVNIPMFLFLGTLGERWQLTLRLVFAMLLAFFVAAFANWYWVG